MSRYEFESHTPEQAQKDLVHAVHLVATYAVEHPGRPIGCQLVVDLPVPPPDYDEPNPV